MRQADKKNIKGGLKKTYSGDGVVKSVVARIKTKPNSRGGAELLLKTTVITLGQPQLLKPKPIGS